MSHYPDLIPLISRKFSSSNQNHYPDLGGDASSAWNSLFVSQASFRGKTSDGDGRCRLFCQGTIDQTAIFVSFFVLYNLKRNLKGSYVNIFCQKSLSYANHYQLPMASSGPEKLQFLIQLFREKLSEKVHATIPKGIMGGFEFTVLRRNLKEWH